MPIFRMPVVLHANYPHANSPNANCPSTDIAMRLFHDWQYVASCGRIK